MDLQAYLNIEDLSAVAEANGIDVPRLRGYRLMALEQPMTEEEIRSMEQSMVRYAYKDGCTSIPRFTPQSGWSEFSPLSDWYLKKYLTPEGDLKWNLIHGKRRKNMKFAVKKKKRAVREECAAWNRYAGREDVLYVRARIGGNNWNYFKGYLLEKEPWFLEKVDDSFDCTYCAIYAKVKIQEEP